MNNVLHIAASYRRPQLLRVSQLRSWLTIISGDLNKVERHIETVDTIKDLEDKLTNALNIARELRNEATKFASAPR